MYSSISITYNLLYISTIYNTIVYTYIKEEEGRVMIKGGN